MKEEKERQRNGYKDEGVDVKGRTTEIGKKNVKEGR